MSLPDIFDAERVKVLERLRELEIEPYPYAYETDTEIGDILEHFDDFDDKEVRLAGRVISIRKHGKTIFMDLRGFTGDVQLYFRVDELKQVTKGKTDGWSLLDLVDSSDILGIRGRVFKTRRGEISVHVIDFDLLAKSLCPMPFGKQKGDLHWYSVSDPRVRYKERYTYWGVYPAEAQKMVVRAGILNSIREFMNGRGFLEVLTPAIEMIYGGAEARPFDVDIWALGGQKAYLRIAPELYLKRYIVGGFPRVYTICQNFRNPSPVLGRASIFSRCSCLAEK